MSIISASTTSTTAYKVTADTTGTLVLQTGSTPTTAIYIDTSQNVGVGTTTTSNATLTVNNANLTSPLYIGSQSDSLSWGGFFVNGATSSTGGNGIYGKSGASLYYNVATGLNHVWTTNGSEKMRIDASGNLGVGVTSPAAYLSLKNGNTSDKANSIRLFDAGGTNGNNYGFGMNNSTGEFSYTAGSGGFHAFYTANSERARFDSGGPLLIGLTSVFNGTTCPLQVANNAANQTFTIRNTNATPYGQYINFGGASPNNTANEFLYCSDTTAQRFTARSNGGLANYSGNNVNLSDRREKTNFAPAKSYLETICAIPVQTFNYIDQNLEEDPGLTLGVVAQDVQAVAPELVMESNWAGKDEEPKMRLSIYQTDLQYALMKCIQEQQAIIETLTNRITALEAK